MYYVFQKQKKKKEWDFNSTSSLNNFQTTALHIAHLEQVFIPSLLIRQINVLTIYMHHNLLLQTVHKYVLW